MSPRKSLFSCTTERNRTYPFATITSDAYRVNIPALWRSASTCHWLSKNANRQAVLGGIVQAVLLNSKIVRFGLVGGGATFVHVIVAAIALYFSPTLPIVLVNMTAFSFAVIVSYVGHMFFTFQTRGSLLKFIITSLIGLLSNNIVAYSSYEMTGFKFFSVLLGTLIAPFVVYVLSTFWVFSNRIKHQ
ncbi:GtrA family protein [Brucella sp.]|uniref:GtrA family protein n=1 Tax=Brucella sp. TaxID=52132 RepID=UPI00391CABB8